MRIYIAVPSDQTVPDGFTPAHIAYRASGSRLYLARGRTYLRGGVAVVSISQSGGAPGGVLAEHIADECEKRGFSGVVFDSGAESTPLLIQTARDIAAAISPIDLFVPEPLGAEVPNAFVLVQTALSGGYLTRHFDECAKLYGADRLAAEIDRVSMDFRLPAYNGTGLSLTPQQDEEYRSGKTIHVSEALCVKYYMHRNDGARHIVLSDDAETISRKLEIAAKFGVRHAFLYLPHVADILHGIRFPDA